jgi:hypothetical protein
LALAVTLGCARATPTKTEAGAKAIVESPEYSLVWGDTPTGVRSYWLEFSRGQLRIAGESSGAMFLVFGQVYRWHPLERVEHVLNACPDTADTADPNDDGTSPNGAPTELASSEITVVGAEALRVDAAGQIPIACPPSVENATLFDNSISLRGSARAYLFIESTSDAMYCGAVHGLNQSSLDTFDLVSQRFVSFPTKPELSELGAVALRSQRASLLACLAPHADAYGRPLGAERLSELEPWSALPVLSPAGQLTFEVQLAMMRSYVEGVVSCPVTVEGASASLSRFAPHAGSIPSGSSSPRSRCAAGACSPRVSSSARRRSTGFLPSRLGASSSLRSTLLATSAKVALPLPPCPNTTDR